MFIFHLSEHLVATLLLVAVGFVGVWLAERWLGGSPTPVLFILVVAALLRVLLLPLPPSLSDDVNRYVWDGQVLDAGLNPYVLPPDDPELTPLRNELWEGLPHRDVATVYPPLAEILFAFSAALPASILTLKTALVLLDLGSCSLLLMLARRWRYPPERVLWYAWNPLVTVEIAGMGHVDALGVALVILTTFLLALPTRRIVTGTLAAAGAVLAKLVPLLALPVWARQSGRSRVFLAGALAVTLAGLLPVVMTSGGIPPGLVEYGVSWEFNGPVFEPLWRALDRIDLRDGVEKGLDRLKDQTGNHDFWNHFYPFNYPQLWAKLLLSIGLLPTLIWAWRTDDTARSMRRVFGSVIVFSATVYPWYALWVLPWAALNRHVAWLALSALLFLSYLPRFLDVPLYPWIHALIWLPFAALMLARRRWSTR